MSYLIGALVGLVWGTAAAFVNSLITKKTIEKNTTKAAMTANYLRIGVDIIALAVVFLLRGLLPFSYEACLIATAIALSMGTLIATFMMSKKLK